MLMKKLVAGSAALAVAAAAATVPARAQDAKPAPTSCAGVTITDPAGDQRLTTGGGGLGPGPANLDLQRVFFRFVPEGGKNVLTANIEITKLDKTLPTGSSSIAWHANWTLADVNYYVSARVTSGGATAYDYGTRSGAQTTSLGETTGKIIEGDLGIVQIVVPADALKLTDKTLTDTYATAGYVQGPGTLFSDRGPDGTAFGKNYKATPCAEGGTPTPVGSDPTPPAGNPPAGDPPPPPSGEQPPSGQPPAPQTQPATLDLKVIAGRLSARKAKRTRSLSLRLRAGERIGSLSAKLLKGSATVGTARLKAFGPGTATLKVKLAKKAARKFKRGVYTLSFTGTKADGRTVSGSVQVSVKK